uniref:Uncharacterized protein n=1 Tax=Rangifer tarandus platyrhynchus TaxID=3082113 RepID=A0ACB0EF49_RANTA|nr:unnamed protein product [Rangifer tarandus platyrhynchus]
MSPAAAASKCVTDHTHTRISRARPAKAPPRSWYPGRVEHQCGTETAPAQSEAAGGLLTGRGGSRPGSAEDAAEQPEPQRCPAAGSPSPGHPSPPGSRYSKGSQRRDADRPSVSLSEGDGPSSGTTEKAKTLLRLSSALTRSGLQSGAAGRSQPAFSLRACCLVSCSANQCQGERIQTEKGKKKKKEAWGGGGRRGEERRRGLLPRPLFLREKKKKKNHRGRGGKSEERRMQETRGARAGTAAVLMLPLRASAPRPAAGQRDSEGFPGARQLTCRDCVCAH